MLGATPAAYALLQRYGWPGNVRELRNVIERAMLLSDGDRLDARDFTGHDEDGQRRRRIRAAAHRRRPRDSWNAASSCRRFGAAAGNQTKAGTLLGLNRDQIRYRIEKFGLTTTQ